MWSACVKALVLGALALAGCGARSLDLAIAFDPACTVPTTVPAGGSLQYLVSSSQSSPDAGAGSFCGGCLAVDAPLASPSEVLTFLRAHAPPCAGVQPGSALLVRINAFDTADCPPGNTPLLCARSPAVMVPDGKSDARVQATLGCYPCSTGTTCTPRSCADQGKTCGFVSDGCTMVLDCGGCQHPLSCGGGGTPNVCGKP